MKNERDRIVVVGGGVIGLCCAYYLGKAGHPVVVLERGGPHVDNCSRGNAGMVVPSHFTPLAAPGVVTQGLKWLLDRESPFYVRPRLSPQLLRWGWLFLRHATSAHVERCGGLLRDLQLASRALFAELAEEGDFGLQQRGLLMLCETQEFLDEEAELAERAAALGLQAEVCSPARLAELDPAARLQVQGGIWFAQDCHLDPERFLHHLREQIVEMGGEIRYHGEVGEFDEDAAILRDGGRVPGRAFVVAGGAWTPQLARRLSVRLPMQAGKGYSMTLQSPSVLPTVCSILGEARVAITPMGDSLRVAGTMEICGNDLSVNERRVQGIIKAACRVYPELSAPQFEGVRRWAGLRPCSPDGLPYLGRVPGRENVVVAAGHAMLGLSMGPVTGKLVADLVRGDDPELPLDLLAVERFS